MQATFLKVMLPVTLLAMLSTGNLQSNTGSPNSIPLNDTPHRRAHHSLVYDEARKRVVLTAGSTPLDGGRSFAFFNDLWAFNGTKWERLGAAGDKRSGVALAYDSKRKKIISFGGFSGNGGLGDLRMLDQLQWKILAGEAEMSLIEAGGVYDAHRDRFVIFGGAHGRSLVNATTWEWNGSSWRAFEGAGPAGRQAFAMVYDSKRKRTVLFGGMGESPDKKYGDTWEFDGSAWIKADSTGPAARMSPGYAYDSKRGLFIIFGGMWAEGMLGDTWAWDGKKWQQLSDTGPSPRAMGHMAYDKNRDRVVLFGGRPGWPNDSAETWEWDGSAWRQVKP